jgi:hypothetical protein
LESSFLSALTVREFTGFEALGASRGEWNDLVSNEQLGPSQSYEWLSTLWSLHGADQELLVLVVSDEQGLTGIVPRILGKDEDWKMKWTSSLREHRDCYIFSRALAARYLYGLHRLHVILKRNG